jgi:hypothetical protein
VIRNTGSAMSLPSIAVYPPIRIAQYRLSPQIRLRAYVG